MNLGISILVFLTIGIVVLILFCLATKYFNKKLERAIQDPNQVFSMIQEINNDQDNLSDDGQYQNYVANLENQKQQKQAKKPKNDYMEIQMTSTRQPLAMINQDIYGLNELQKKLAKSPQNNEPRPLNPQSKRSTNSRRSFKPQRLTQRQSSFTNRSKSSANSSQEICLPPSPSNKKNKVKKVEDEAEVYLHKYISKIISYTQQNIEIVQNELLSVQKKENGVIQKKNTRKQVIKPTQSMFNDILEIYGFDKGEYCAYKFETILEILHMKERQEYPVQFLKSSEAKIEIQFAEYFLIKEQFENCK